MRFAVSIFKIAKGMNILLIINANILPMDSSPVENGFVRINDGKIADVGDMKSLKPLHGEETLDLDGKLLLPGFIDAHCHVGLYEDGLGLEGDDLNEDSDPVTPHIRSIDGINPFDRCFAEARQHGVTCAVVSPGSANPVAGQICALKTAGRRVDDMLVAQPLAIKFALGENPKSIYGSKNQTPVTRMATVAIIREQLQKAKRYLDEKNRAKADSELDEPDFDARMEALIPLLEGKIRAHFHAHKAYDILSAVRIAKEFSLKYTLIHCTEGHLIADILAEEEAKVVCGPLLCARTKPELAGLSVENCGSLADAGVLVAISTDHPEVPINFLAGSAAIAASGGMSREKAIEAITIAAARAVELDSRIGSITAGKDADLLVFAHDPFSVGAKPEMVFIDGKLVN